MSQADEEVQPVDPAGADPRSGVPGTALARRAAAGSVDVWADLRPAYRWVRRGRPVPVAALILIAAQVAWRAELLGHLFFYRDDFFALDLARRSGFSWRYLTYIGTGHLVITERVIAWVLARMSLYGWGLASAVSLVLLAACGLAAYAALRTVFGERPAILIPLAVYLFTPLGLADLGWWSAAMESLPLQLFLLLAVHAHVSYLRGGRRRSLIAAIAWVALALASSEKGVLVPVLLFAVTSAFLPGRRSWLANAGLALRRYRWIWAGYTVALAAYGVVLATSLTTASASAGVPSGSAALTFSWGLLRNSLAPAAFGGPWRWWPLPGGATALALPPQILAWLAIGLAVVVVLGSIASRPVAWRAWAALTIWVIGADLLPVLAGKLNWYPVLLALNTRYVADARPVLALCLGLAFLQVRPSLVARDEAGRDNEAGRPASGRARTRPAAQVWRPAAAALMAVFLVGSVWSARAFQAKVTGAPAAAYIGAGTAAAELAPAGTRVLTSGLPDQLASVGSDTRTVLGPLSPGTVRWLSRPDGTIDNLRIFGSDGRLHPLWVYGAASGRGPARGCWRAHRGLISVPFLRPAPYLTTMLRIGYLWGAARPGHLRVTYGGTLRMLTVRHGLHTAYLPVTGSAQAVQVTGFHAAQLCIGDAEAGQPGPQSSSASQGVPSS